jgi:hypothetical protein
VGGEHPSRINILFWRKPPVHPPLQLTFLLFTFVKQCHSHPGNDECWCRTMHDDARPPFVVGKNSANTKPDDFLPNYIYYLLIVEIPYYPPIYTSTYALRRLQRIIYIRTLDDGEEGTSSSSARAGRPEGVLVTGIDWFSS